MTHSRIPILLAALLTAAPALAGGPPAAPVPRDGTCPSGYSVSGSYCSPGSRGAYAVPRARGVACASGYSVSGDYCLAGPNARLAVPRSGTCPSGFSASGGYCLSSR